MKAEKIKDFNFCIQIIESAKTEFQLFSAQIIAEKFLDIYSDHELFNQLINKIASNEIG